MVTQPHTPAHVRFEEILGVSPWARRIRDEVVRVARFDSTVLLTGPTGTGKELLARMIHAASPRAHRPFIPVDCAATTGTLFASHVFGHTQGAFTGASHAELGCFRAAQGGTVFLDEIGELEHDLQAMLLRVLQQRTVTPVGSHEEVPVDVRVISATHRHLEAEVLAGRFREDLYYRLNVISLQTSPLKERPEDLQSLAAHILAELAIHLGLPLKRLSDEVLELLRSYDWPGNVRQLENVLERAFLFSEGEIIRPEAIFLPSEAPPAAPEGQQRFPLASLGSDAPSSAVAEPVAGRAASPEASDCVCRRAGLDNPAQPAEGNHWPTIDEVERELIQRTLAHANFNQSAAARLLHMTRDQFLRKIQKYGIDLSRSTRGRPRQSGGRSGSENPPPQVARDSRQRPTQV